MKNGVQDLQLTMAGHKLTVKRSGDLESLWSEMEDSFGNVERIPYWTEVWPSSVVLAEHLDGHRHLLQGKLCLEAGCGLGATAILASRFGARVVALDIEWPALHFARQSQSLNWAHSVYWVCMDWQNPAFKEQKFDFIWAGDVLYETRLAMSLSCLLDHCLAPDGRVWIADQERNVSGRAWKELLAQGYKSREISRRKVHWFSQKAGVRLVELSR